MSLASHRSIRFRTQGSSGVPHLYFVFDVMILAGRDVTKLPLEVRQELLQAKVLPKLAEPIRYPGVLNASLNDLIRSVKRSGLEGLVAKRRDSLYEVGLRSGSWREMRINKGQEFVIGRFTLGGTTFDALIFGYYEGDRLIYEARTPNGYTPTLRTDLMKRFEKLRIDKCQFANLPEPRSGRWGAGLTLAKMNNCQWLRPELVGQFEFLGWTPQNHLRHTRFVGLREDKTPKEVRRET